MTDWDSATDPVQPVREREEQIRQKRYAARRKREQQLGLHKVAVATVPAFTVDREFDEEL